MCVCVCGGGVCVCAMWRDVVVVNSRWWVLPWRETLCKVQLLGKGHFKGEQEGFSDDRLNLTNKRRAFRWQIANYIFYQSFQTLMKMYMNITFLTKLTNLRVFRWQNITFRGLHSLHLNVEVSPMHMYIQSLLTLILWHPFYHFKNSSFFWPSLASAVSPISVYFKTSWSWQHPLAWPSHDISRNTSKYMHTLFQGKVHIGQCTIQNQQKI